MYTKPTNNVKKTTPLCCLVPFLQPLHVIKFAQENSCNWKLRLHNIWRKQNLQVIKESCFHLELTTKVNTYFMEILWRGGPKTLAKVKWLLLLFLEISWFWPKDNYFYVEKINSLQWLSAKFMKQDTNKQNKPNQTLRARLHWRWLCNFQLKETYLCLH